MHARVSLDECFAHANHNLHECMTVEWNHTLTVLKIIAALLCRRTISSVPKQALSHHSADKRVCPTQRQVTINTTQVDRGQIGHLNETCTRGQTTQTMHICAHLDEQTGGLGGLPEDAHVLHDTPNHLRGAQGMVSRTKINHEDMLVFVWPKIC